MKRYKDFCKDLLNESVVYLSQELISALRRIQYNKVAKAILDLDQKLIDDDVTLLDISSQDGNINFSTARRAKQFLIANGAQELANLFDQEGSGIISRVNRILPRIWQNARVDARVGRVVNKLLPNKFSQSEVEEFVNIFRAALSGDGQTIEVVKGDDIAKWYAEENYLESTHTLGASCMKKVSKDILEVYTKNPDVFSMVCVFQTTPSGDKKLAARAILWQVDTCVQLDKNIRLQANFEANKPNLLNQFMDRQYAISDIMVEKLRSWAREQGIPYRFENSFIYTESVLIGGSKLDVAMRTQIDFVPKAFPYMDTFRTFVPEEKNFYNSIIANSGNWILDTVGGRMVEHQVW